MEKLCVLFLIIIAAIFVFFSIKLFRYLAKSTVKKKELCQAAADRMRDENLNQIILNPGQMEKNKVLSHMPYEVNYENGSKENRSDFRQTSKIAGNSVMIQLVENTELSSRKFVLNPKEGIRIGSGFSDNEIVAVGGKIAEHQCEIFAVREKIYIKSFSSEIRTLVRRKKEQAIVNERGVQLLTGDRILLGDIYYDITII